MGKKEKIYPQCPCCKIKRHRTEMKKMISIMEKMNRKSFQGYERGQEYESFIDSHFDWACDICLNKGKAVLAGEKLQNAYWMPHLVYFDSKHMCSVCGAEFIFSKSEKRFWYEELEFFMDAVPVDCLSCRKEKQELKKENKVISDILVKEESELHVEELEKVIEIYQKWNKTEKVRYYQALIRKIQ